MPLGKPALHQVCKFHARPLWQAYACPPMTEEAHVVISVVGGLERSPNPRPQNDVSMTGAVAQPAQGSRTQGNPNAQVSPATAKQAKTGDSQAITQFGALLASLLLDAQPSDSTTGQETATGKTTP